MDLMGDVHRLILQHGLEEARTFATTKGERAAIEAAALVLGEEESRLGITHAGFGMTSLPHKTHRRRDLETGGASNDIARGIGQESGRRCWRPLRLNSPLDPTISANRGCSDKCPRG
jgi:hypothetical protein